MVVHNRNLEVHPYVWKLRPEELRVLDTLWQFNISIIEHDHLHLPIKHADFPSQTASLPEGNVGTSLFDLSNHPVLGTRVPERAWTAFCLLALLRSSLRVSHLASQQGHMMTFGMLGFEVPGRSHQTWLAGKSPSFDVDLRMGKSSINKGFNQLPRLMAGEYLIFFGLIAMCRPSVWKRDAGFIPDEPEVVKWPNEELL